MIENKQREAVLIADSFDFLKNFAISDTRLHRPFFPIREIARPVALARRGGNSNRVSMGNKNSMQPTQNKQSDPFLIEFFRHYFLPSVRFQTLATRADRHASATSCAVVFPPPQSLVSSRFAGLDFHHNFPPSILDVDPGHQNSRNYRFATGCRDNFEAPACQCNRTAPGQRRTHSQASKRGEDKQ